MKELKNIPQKRMPEVIERAARIQADEELQLESEQEKNALVLAAQEVGIAPAHVQRAAAELQRADATKLARRRKITLISAVLALVLALTVSLYMALRTPTAPAWENAVEVGSQAWELKINPESKASLRFEAADDAEGQVAVLTVEAMTPPAGSQKDFFINLVSVHEPSAPLNLSGHEAVHVRLRADGTLRFARVDLHASPTERWRSPNIPLSTDWKTHDLPLSSFERQTKNDQGQWITASHEAPKKLQSIGVKVGYFINDAAARGTLWLDDISSR